MQSHFSTSTTHIRLMFIYIIIVWENAKYVCGGYVEGNELSVHAAARTLIRTSDTSPIRVNKGEGEFASFV